MVTASVLVRREAAAHGLLRGRFRPEAARAGNGCGRLSSPDAAHPTRQVAWGPRGKRVIPRETRKPPSAVLRCASAARARARGASPSRSRQRKRHEGRDGRGFSLRWTTPMTTERDSHDYEPPHASSPTARIVESLELHGYHPGRGEHDPRPMPEPLTLQGALADVFDALVSTFTDTPLEPDLEQLLWSTVNVFHRQAGKAQRDLDDNEDAQKRSQREQDGSEIKSVELERLLVEGQDRIDRRDTYEAMRDQAGDLFELHTGTTWKPHAGSLANRKAMTAAMIDSRDFISAKRRAETEVLIPKGAKIAFTGGMDCNDHRRIWDALDKVHAKHADMVLLHGGSPKGAELIAAKWADTRKVQQIAFKPDWTKHAKAAPFKRNDQLLEVMPIGIIVFPGSGISDNLADKARKLGIPLFDFRKGNGA